MQLETQIVNKFNARIHKNTFLIFHPKPKLPYLQSYPWENTYYCKCLCLITFPIYCGTMSKKFIIIFFIYPCSGSKIFSTFIGFLKSKDPGDGTEQALLNELTAFNGYLKENVSHLK